MGKLRITPGGEGADLDAVTATAADVLAPKVIVGPDGEPLIGTMPDRGDWNFTELAAGASETIPGGKHGGGGKVTAKSLASQTGGATADDGYVYSGKTYWKEGTLRTGNMSVNSVLSFSAAAYGGKQILLAWQNPYAATGKPFSGVEIRYATDGYRGAGGTVIYSGIGSNSAAGGWSQVIATLPAFGTGYYFSIRAYANTSNGMMYSDVLNAYTATQNELWLTFTSSQTYTIPTGYSMMDAFAVGGGGSTACARSSGGSCHGAGSGYTKQQNGIAVLSGDSIAIAVGMGGNSGANGSSSIVSKNGITAIDAKGGTGVYATNNATPGGSGGGCSNDISSEPNAYYYSGRGGSDGSNGYDYGKTSDTGGFWYKAKGQGTTTRAWGSGTLYAGAGGAGNKYRNPGSGGDGGGGHGDSYYVLYGSDGAPNTGGGAGGCSSGTNETEAYGGSGIVLLHIY